MPAKGPWYDLDGRTQEIAWLIRVGDAAQAKTWDAAGKSMLSAELEPGPRP
jgi:hypothetical protein